MPLRRTVIRHSMTGYRNYPRKSLDIIMHYDVLCCSTAQEYSRGAHIVDNLTRPSHSNSIMSSSSSSSTSSTTASSASSATASSSSSRPMKPFFEPWTCDVLTPDLCGDDLQVEKGSLEILGVNVVYWRYYSSSANNQNLFPMVVVAGGGMPHSYLLPLKQQACRGRTVYFYDPAGCGASITSPTNATTAHLEDLQYYATQELPALLNHWNLGGSKNTKFHVYGHAEGGIVAMLYSLQSNAKNPAASSLMISSAYSDKTLYQQAQWDAKTGTLGRLPVFVQQRLLAIFQKCQGQPDSLYREPEYWEIMSYIYRAFYMRTHPSPTCLIDALQGSNWRIHMILTGGPGGNVWPPQLQMPHPQNNYIDAKEEKTSALVLDSHFNMTADLSKIQIPVYLLTGGNQFDIVRPHVTDVLEEHLPITERIEFVNAGHMPVIDDPGAVNHALADFMDRIETSRKFRPQATTSVSSTVDMSYYLSGNNNNKGNNGGDGGNGGTLKVQHYDGSAGHLTTTAATTTSNHFFGGHAVWAIFMLIGGTIAWRKYRTASSVRATYDQLQV